MELQNPNLRRNEMVTELFNIWEEKWNEIDEIWKPSEIHNIGTSPNWVYFMWVQERSIRLIRIDRDTIDKLNSSKN